MCSPQRRARVARVGALISSIALACASPAPRGADSAAPSRQAAESDTARLARLEREARALAATTCDAASSCRTAPVGWRACGGPRDYVVYCAAGTDTVALLRTLEELKRAEAEYNERTGMASTCEMRLPPSVGLQGGRCAAAGQPVGGDPPPS
jgi:hypothetical protein